MASRDSNQDGILYKRRNGTCHRCGWKGSVSKVGRNDRKRLGIDRQYGRLCEDCASDLARNKRGGDSATGHPHSNIRVIRDSDVA
jgi:hypothetical protein